MAVFLLLAGLSDRVVLDQEVFPFWSYVARAAVLLIPAFSKNTYAPAGALIVTVSAPLILAAL
jgi:hypothetical protein